MTINEQTRHRLHRDLEQAMNEESATVLMEHLPPIGWADVATKRDLDAALVGLEGRLHMEMAAQTRTIVFTMLTTMIGAVASTGALAFAAARLT